MAWLTVKVSGEGVGWVGYKKLKRNQSKYMYVESPTFTLWCVPSFAMFSFLFFSLRSSRYQLGKTVAAEQTQWPVEHVKNTQHESEFGAIQ